MLGRVGIGTAERTTGRYFGRLTIALVVLTISSTSWSSEQEAPHAPQVVSVAGRNLQTVIDGAPPHSTVICNRNHELVLTAPIASLFPVFGSTAMTAIARWRLPIATA